MNSFNEMFPLTVMHKGMTVSVHRLTARKTICPFSKCSEKTSFPKKIALEYVLSGIIRNNDISFSRKYDIIL